jgi:hypothetical protein
VRSALMIVERRLARSYRNRRLRERLTVDTVPVVIW